MKLKRSLFLIASLLFVTVVLVGCGKAQPSGPPAPDFMVKTIDGPDFTLSEQRGQVVIMYAMAAWCPTCIPETKALARIYQEYRDRGVVVLILDVDTRETEQHLLQFKRVAGGGDHYWAMDEGNRWALAYEIRALDTTVIVDRKGRVAYRDEVPTPYEKLKEEVEPLL